MAKGAALHQCVDECVEAVPVTALFSYLYSYLTRQSSQTRPIHGMKPHQSIYIFSIWLQPNRQHEAPSRCLPHDTCHGNCSNMNATKYASLALAAALAAVTLPSRADVQVDVGIGFLAPVVVAPPPAYGNVPQPIYVTPQPVYAPRPVVAVPPPEVGPDWRRRGDDWRWRQWQRQRHHHRRWHDESPRF